MSLRAVWPVNRDHFSAKDFSHFVLWDGQPWWTVCASGVTTMDVSAGYVWYYALLLWLFHHCYILCVCYWVACVFCLFMSYRYRVIKYFVMKIFYLHSYIDLSLLIKSTCSKSIVLLYHSRYFGSVPLDALLFSNTTFFSLTFEHVTFPGRIVSRRCCGKWDV